ncbi:hypothetical protein [Micromonospora sp. NBC_01796]|uniref:hypothetical protein n=1 Tax=Micromonospora sp. NBC_01796 TaxID=2975987 RepID=UPI002DDBF9FE|nr:hypothetical protein [Micromonospora sp. NBC_01796]WSA85540.1 hypothetical protein OIE47_35195 [Micromonospora sp. NBC_01796]
MLATLLTLTTAGAALAGSTTDGATVAARTDAYIRDVAGDVGTEPHYLNPLWASPDIKVCPTAIECATSQNPIVGVTNYVFVKLNNPGPYGSGVSNGTLELYRTTPGGGATWPIHWTLIGATPASAAPGVTTVTIPWNGVPGPGHFCLLARWVSPTDPMTSEGPSHSINVQYNNNLAWRNVDSVNPAPGSPAVRPFAIGNETEVPTRNDLVFNQRGEPFQNAGGRIVADLGPVLFERWVQAGRPGTGIREVGRNQVEIVAANAKISDLLLNPGERPAFSLIFSTTTVSSRLFTVDVVQFGPAKAGGPKTDVGGVQYLVRTAQR